MEEVDLLSSCEITNLYTLEPFGKISALQTSQLIGGQ